MTPLRPTQAADAAARLQEGVRSGLPVMIPGAWESRDYRPIVPVIETTAPVQSSHAAGSGVDRERLEHAREGGGAPSQPGTLLRTLAKIWRYIRPADAPVL